MICGNSLQKQSSAKISMMSSSTAANLKSREWTKGDYYVTTDHKKIPLKKLNDAFESPTCYWAKALPLEVLEETLQHSLCFGLFHRTTVENNTSEHPPSMVQGPCFAFYETVFDQEEQTRITLLLHRLQKLCSSASHAASQTFLHSRTSLMSGSIPHVKGKDLGDG